MPTHTAEAARRRTFAIISHPDAGKTTLTEKFLLFGGAIRQAGPRYVPSDNPPRPHNSASHSAPLPPPSPPSR